jgi:ribonuclease D
MISRFLPTRLRRLLGVKVTTRPPAYQLLDQPDSLPPLLQALESVEEVALDTEADNMFHYKTRVCLLQFLVDGEVYLVDVLAPGMKLDALWKVLARKHLVMHGSDFDLRLRHDARGATARPAADRAGVAA